MKVFQGLIGNTTDCSVVILLNRTKGFSVININNKIGVFASKQQAPTNGVTCETKRVILTLYGH